MDTNKFKKSAILSAIAVLAIGMIAIVVFSYFMSPLSWEGGWRRVADNLSAFFLAAILFYFLLMLFMGFMKWLRNRKVDQSVAKTALVWDIAHTLMVLIPAVLIRVICAMLGRGA